MYVIFLHLNSQRASSEINKLYNFSIHISNSIKLRMAIVNNKMGAHSYHPLFRNPIGLCNHS